MASSLDPLTQLTKQWQKAVQNGEQGLWWFENIDPTALLALCDRQPVVDALKRLMSQTQTPGDWGPLKSSADYMAQLEAGFRSRFRSRIQCLGNSAPVQDQAITDYVDVLTQVSAYAAGGGA